MNKNYLYAGLGILILLVAGLGFVFKPQKVQMVPTTQAPAEKTEVDYTDSGFSPASVIIKKDQTVNFVNKSSSQMWVASNPHPIHTDYPGFDELSAGDSYTFTFDKVGTWGYHNHINPAQKGTVVVTE